MQHTLLMERALTLTFIMQHVQWSSTSPIQRVLTEILLQEENDVETRTSQWPDKNKQKV